ncbi:uncharacterized protein LOC122274618 [Carya illinoinensis]|uniref:uncharacterized protein LOC122274618 n=1 Tax=Carya illinoinensis TaxID=32201 RepID=UPI001C726F59|nr:uncharacterized protein LOC122274618 [Carya illinoinensis]
MGKLPKSLMEEVGSVMRLVWARRNEFVHGKGFRHPDFVMHKALDDLTCFKTTKHKYTNERVADYFENQQWKPPPEGTYKLKWDAAINQSLVLTGIGAIIRDCNDQVFGTLRVRRSYNFSPFTAEAYAMMITTLFCKKVGFHSIMFKGDSLQVVERMQKSVTNWSQGGLIIEDTKHLLQEFVAWSFRHRDSNMAAHMLGKNALLNECDLYYLEEIPNCIRHVVQLGLCNSVFNQ